jgi:D-xylose transport system permease protein
VSTDIETTAPGTATAAVPRPTVGSHARDYLSRLRGGDIGSLPAVLGLVVLCTIFSLARPTFFTTGNFANMFQQGAQVTLIAMGLVFVLILGEIDLSVGYASGVCAAVMAVLLNQNHSTWYESVGVALVTGIVIGSLLGILVAKLGIPSFVVTLAAFLAFQGLLLILLKGGTNEPVRDPVIVAIATRNMSVPVSWGLAILAVVAFAVTALVRHRGRAVRGLVTDPIGIVLARIAGVSAVVMTAVAVLTRERSNNPFTLSVKGVPIVVPVIAALLIVLSFVLQRTGYGRHVYAVGGNAEAARRAGIDVDKIRISVFMIGSCLAAVGGIVAASRFQSVGPDTGGSNVLLYAVGAAVIGGTSLFGGKGRVIDAVIGGAVIAVIDNGMGLMGFSSGQKYMFTGLVLLIAASIDAVSRRRAAATGNR